MLVLPIGDRLMRGWLSVVNRTGTSDQWVGECEVCEVNCCWSELVNEYELVNMNCWWYTPVPVPMCAGLMLNAKSLCDGRWWLNET